MTTSEASETRYRNLCSLETLRSGSKGFFRDFSEKVIRVVGEQWIDKVFGRLTSDEDRVRVVFTDVKVRDTVLETLNRTVILYRGKDASVARAKRLEGFEAAAAGRHRDALLLFAQAVLRAPSPGSSSSFLFLLAGHFLPRDRSFFFLLFFAFREMQRGRSRLRLATRATGQSRNFPRLEPAPTRPSRSELRRGDGPPSSKRVEVSRVFNKNTQCGRRFFEKRKKIFFLAHTPSIDNCHYQRSKRKDINFGDIKVKRNNREILQNE